MPETETDHPTPLDALKYLLAQFRLYSHGKLNWRDVRDLLPRMQDHITRFETDAAQPSGTCKADPT